MLVSSSTVVWFRLMNPLRVFLLLLYPSFQIAFFFYILLSLSVYSLPFFVCIFLSSRFLLLLFPSCLQLVPFFFVVVIFFFLSSRFLHLLFSSSLQLLPLLLGTISSSLSVFFSHFLCPVIQFLFFLIISFPLETAALTVTSSLSLHKASINYFIFLFAFLLSLHPLPLYRSLSTSSFR